ncbi:hypothetical protein NDU88_001707 [Pleurodeles waltl]|uniref:Uncharacterized protein n=1 Tax=Pleurodeles waltl TaxID=8319 RepID=A0AAV7NFX5_PLEWA|nr:hypothetical protein NDU88_001707 [Pleurodeles waltl]
MADTALSQEEEIEYRDDDTTDQDTHSSRTTQALKDATAFTTIRSRHNTETSATDSESTRNQQSPSTSPLTHGPIFTPRSADEL